jgi:hypothetical protein
MHRFLLTALIVVLSISLSSAQNRQNKKESVDSASTRIFPLPIFFYTPETGVAGGVAALLVYRDPGTPRASSITGDIIYTEKKQIIIIQSRCVTKRP